MNIIEFNNVTKNLYNFSLKPTNIVLKKGEILGIVGKPGSGKTTIAKLILNFYRPKSGNISVFGLDSVTDNKEIKKDTSVIPQSTWFKDTMRPMTLIRDTMKMRNVRDFEEIDFLLEYFDLKINRKIGDMSFLDKRKLAIINGLVCNSPLVIVDEPDNITDSKTRVNLYNILEEKNREGASVLILCSNLVEAQSICDNIYYLHGGKIIEEEDQSDKLSNDKILKFYDKDVNRSIFDHIGAKLVKSGNETVYYYSGPLDILAEAIYKTGLIDFTVEDSTLNEKLIILEKENAFKKDNLIIPKENGKFRKKTKSDKNEEEIEIEEEKKSNNQEIPIEDTVVIKENTEEHDKIINSNIAKDIENNSQNNTDTPSKIEVEEVKEDANNDLN